MGSALQKTYNVEAHATASGGHCYLWKVYKATRKKDGRPVSVFVFDKTEFEKSLTKQGVPAKRIKFVKEIVFDIMKKEVAALRDMAGAKGADGAATPPGVLRLLEAPEENKQALVFVSERVLCSLGNATHRDWRGVDAAHVPSEVPGGEGGGAASGRRG
jgi:SCY1-like protein 2